MGAERTERARADQLLRPATDSIRDFERLAELLRLDAVGVAVGEGDRPQVTWWGAPGTTLPDPIGDLLSGSVSGWVVTPLPDGSKVFARLTTRSSTRTPVVLQAVGPMLAASAHGTVDLEEAPDRSEQSPVTSAIESAMSGLRRDLGFETASFFVRDAHGWELLARQGPVQPWHSVLDPGALEGTPEAAEYPDVRALPGLGVRLAGLGCASAAILPVPHIGRVLLDSSTPCLTKGWIERAKPFLELLTIMAGPGWSAGGALRTYQEVGTMSRVFSALQDAMIRPGTEVEDLLDDVRDALGASEVFLLTERGAHIDVTARPPGAWPRTLSRHARARIKPDGEPSLPDEAVKTLALELGVASPALAGAAGRDDRVEVFLAGWADGLALSPVSMAVVARAVSTARIALQGRRDAVVSMLDRERTRMAYALHDGLVQTVVSAVLELEALRKRFDQDPGNALETLESAKAEIRRSLGELRSILFDLSRSAGDEASPEPISRYVEDVVRRWRLPARVSVEGRVDEVPDRTLAVAYVVIREALANAAKHAGTREVAVKLGVSDGELLVSIHDEGRGFTSHDEVAARQANHFGLDMLRRRVREAGGELTVESTPGRGTEVVAKIPYQEERR